MSKPTKGPWRRVYVLQDAPAEQAANEGAWHDLGECCDTPELPRQCLARLRAAAPHLCYRVVCRTTYEEVIPDAD
jgi:hypothetical protein